MDPRTREAFARWTLAQPAVSAFVHAVVIDRAERDEVLQDVAIAVLESFPSYDPARPFVPWAIGIARHAVADSLRRRLAHLADCVRELDGRAREVCDLRYRLDFSATRIGELLGIQPNTAAKALQRVRE